MLRLIPLTFLLLISFLVKAQNITVKGIVRDTADKNMLTGATVQFRIAEDTLKKFSAATDKKGVFILTNLIPGNYILTITSVGYETVKRNVKLNADRDFGTIAISKAADLLSEVTVKVSVPPVKQKGDTLEYGAAAFKVNPDATGEDLIKKMPGVTVDKAGTVTAQGEQVRKVTVDGREFFGDDATAALRNLPAEVIDKIQVFDRLSDQAQFTGVDDGNSSKSINIVTKANMRNGQFGRIYAGYGTDDRYSGGGNVSFFKGNRRISLVGLTNNINQQNFSSQDLLGVTSSGGGGGGNRGGGGGNRGGGGAAGGGNRGGGGGAGGGNFGGTNNFLVGQQSGISKTNAFGINYSDLWGKKKNVSVTGSYFFNNSSTTNGQISNNQTTYSADTTQFYHEISDSKTDNYNHRVNLRVEYKIDSNNSIFFTPTISFQKNNGISTVYGETYYGTNDTLNRTFNQNDRSTSGYNISNNLLYRHAFHKRGRTISLNIGTGFNEKDGDVYLQALNQYFKAGPSLKDTVKQYTDQSSNGYQLSANLVYTEPIGKKGQLQLNYNPSYSKSKSDQKVSIFDPTNQKYSKVDTSQSSKFDNDYITQNAGLTYRLGDRDKMLAVGLAYQTSDLNSDQFFPYATMVRKTYHNFLPNLMLRYKLNTKSNLNIFYRTSTNPPSISQLQDVINQSNSLFLTTGNPELNQQYSQTLATRFSYANSAKGQSFFANVFLQQATDYVANGVYRATNGDSVLTPTVTLYKGSQLSKPVNLDGYWSVRSFLTYGMPLKFIKSNLNLNAGFSYVRTPGLINDVANITDAYNYSAGAVIGSNISQYVDFNLSYTGNFNKVFNSVQPDQNSDYFTQTAGIQINMLSKKGWFWQNDLNNQSNKGLSDGFNQNYWLWNMAIGRKFLKNQNGELKISVFDLLKQNRSITRTVTGNEISDVQSQVLQQYFMATFTYKLRNFGKASARSQRNQSTDRPEDRMMEGRPQQPRNF